eukprot:2971406-Amphidinium_carterae.1
MPIRLDANMLAMSHLPLKTMTKSLRLENRRLLIVVNPNFNNLLRVVTTDRQVISFGRTSFL